MAQTDRSIEHVEKVLGEPAFAEFPESAWKIRTNLMVMSLIAIAMVFGELHIEPDSEIVGLKFKGLSDAVLEQGLFAVIVYLLSHFLWVAFDSMLEWRLRVTGTRVAFVTTGMFASEHADYPGDPRQSTFYNWWTGEAKKIGHLSRHLPEYERKLGLWEADLKAKFTTGADALNIVHANKLLSDAKQELTDLKHAITRAEAAWTAQRVPASLLRFDRWFELFLRSQNLRWLLVDALAPVLLGGYALLLLASR